MRTCLLVAASASITLVLAVGALPGSAPGASGESPHSQPATTSMFPATGYFRVAEQDGRWYFVTPQGAPFYASGIDTVTAHGDTDQTTGQCPYCEAVAADYPDAAAWETTTLARLRSWGFNTLGPFSDYGALGSRMPFEVELSMASGSDWFAPSFVTNADQVAAAQVAPLADSRNLIGYFTDSELNWGPPDTPHQETLLDEYLSLPPGSPGLAVAQRYKGNPDGFLTAVATRYFSVTTAAIRKYDTHHLILGVKAEGQEIQPQVLEAANHYIDVFSIEDYLYKPGLNAAIDRIWPYYLPIESNLADFEAYFKKPLMIGEYAFIAAGAQDPDTVPGIYDVSPTQAARATSFENFVAPLYEDAPWLVGDDWFEYVDEPAGGRTGDGENNDFGMVNVEDQPYPTMEAAMRLMHSVTSAQLLQTGPTCDSWAASGARVTCTATVPHAESPLQIVTKSLVAGKVDAAYGGLLRPGGLRRRWQAPLPVPGRRWITPPGAQALAHRRGRGRDPDQTGDIHLHGRGHRLDALDRSLRKGDHHHRPPPARGQDTQPGPGTPRVAVRQSPLRHRRARALHLVGAGGFAASGHRVDGPRGARRSTHRPGNVRLHRPGRGLEPTGDERDLPLPSGGRRLEGAMARPADGTRTGHDEIRAKEGQDQRPLPTSCTYSARAPSTRRIGRAPAPPLGRSISRDDPFPPPVPYGDGRK